MKTTINYKVVSCSGIMDINLPSRDKCPFYSGGCVCLLDDHIIENPYTILTIIPDDCLLRKSNILVETDVLNQQELFHVK